MKIKLNLRIICILLFPDKNVKKIRTNIETNYFCEVRCDEYVHHDIYGTSNVWHVECMARRMYGTSNVVFGTDNTDETRRLN